MTPYFVATVDFEEAEFDEALDLNAAEDKVLQQNACHNMRRKTMVRISTKLSNPPRQKVTTTPPDTVFPDTESHNGLASLSSSR
jgi:hypothetical protein